MIIQKLSPCECDDWQGVSVLNDVTVIHMAFYFPRPWLRFARRKPRQLSTCSLSCREGPLVMSTRTRRCQDMAQRIDRFPMICRLLSKSKRSLRDHHYPSSLQMTPDLRGRSTQGPTRLDLFVTRSPGHSPRGQRGTNDSLAIQTREEVPW